MEIGRRDGGSRPDRRARVTAKSPAAAQSARRKIAQNVTAVTRLVVDPSRE
jgi:hypothetical protein